METCRRSDEGRSNDVSEQGPLKSNGKKLIVLDVLDNKNGEDLPAHFLMAVEWMINRGNIL
jgi:hypothetical protein